MSRPTFYRVFSSKQEAYEELDRIAVAYLQRVMEQLDTQNDAQSDAHARQRDLLDLVIASYFEWRIGLRISFDGTSAIAEPPGLTHARRTLLLGHATVDATRGVLLSGLLCAIDALASSWAGKDMPSTEAVQERRLMASELVLRTLT